MTELSATERDVAQAVENGNQTVDELVAATDYSKGHVQKTLKNLVDAGELDRHRDGVAYAYEVPSESEDESSTSSTQSSTDADDDIMPANRNYDWDNSDYKPDPADYYSSDGELERLMAQIEHRETTNSPVRALVSGPTGSGKTTLAQSLAAWLDGKEDTSYFSIQFSKDMNDGDLVGVPNLGGDKTVWVDGVLSKAFLAASEDGHGDSRTVVLHLDELNRAPPHVHNALFEALDHRGAIRLDGPRGGELIEADPLDIIVIATINEGAEYHGTNHMDLAAKSRFTAKFEVDYLAHFTDDGALVGVDDEAKLLVDDHDIPVPLARSMVEAAAEVRRDADDDSNMNVEWGIPTRALKAWAGFAKSYDLAELNNPVMQAAEDAIIGNLYDGPNSGDAQRAVRTTLESFLDGAPVDGDEFEAWNADEQVSCSACGWSAAKPDAEDMGVLATMTCPECNDDEHLDLTTK